MLSITTVYHILLLQYELQLQDINKYVIMYMVQFGPQGMTLQLWCKTSDNALLHVQATCLLLNLAICLRCMKKWNYNGTDTIPNSYTITMIRSAGAKFPPEYSDRNTIVKTQCVKQTWLSGNCRASPVVSVSSKTQLAQLIQSAPQQPLQHGTVVAVFLYVLLLLYLSLIVTDLHSTKVSLLSHISPWYLSQNVSFEQQ